MLGCGVCRGFWGSVSSQCGSPVTVWGLQTDLGSHRWGSLGVHSRPLGLHRCSLGVSRGFRLTQVSQVVTRCHLLTPHPSLLSPGTPGGCGGGVAMVTIPPCPPPPDVQKFPLRMKDNDLLVTELYRDPSEDAVTALSVYLTPKSSKGHLLHVLITSSRSSATSSRSLSPPRPPWHFHRFLVTSSKSSSSSGPLCHLVDVLGTSSRPSSPPRPPWHLLEVLVTSKATLALP